MQVFAVVQNVIQTELSLKRSGVYNGVKGRRGLRGRGVAEHFSMKLFFKG